MNDYRTPADMPPEPPEPRPPWWTKQNIQLAAGIVILVTVVVGLAIASYAAGEFRVFLTIAGILVVLGLIVTAIHLIFEATT